MEIAGSGTHIVMESDNSINIICGIGYNYNSMKVLRFIYTPGMG